MRPFQPLPRRHRGRSSAFSGRRRAKGPRARAAAGKRRPACAGTGPAPGPGARSHSRRRRWSRPPARRADRRPPDPGPTRRRCPRPGGRFRCRPAGRGRRNRDSTGSSNSSAETLHTWVTRARIRPETSAPSIQGRRKTSAVRSPARPGPGSWRSRGARPRPARIAVRRPPRGHPPQGRWRWARDRSRPRPLGLSLQQGLERLGRQSVARARPHSRSGSARSPSPRSSKAVRARAALSTEQSGKALAASSNALSAAVGGADQLLHLLADGGVGHADLAESVVQAARIGVEGLLRDLGRRARPWPFSRSSSSATCRVEQPEPALHRVVGRPSRRRTRASGPGPPPRHRVCPRRLGGPGFEQPVQKHHFASISPRHGTS